MHNAYRNALLFRGCGLCMKKIKFPLKLKLGLNKDRAGRKHRGFITSGVWELSPVDLILHHVGPVEQTAVEVEVESDGVAKAGHEQAVVTFMKVDSSDLVPNREDNEGLKGIWEMEETNWSLTLHTCALEDSGESGFVRSHQPCTQFFFVREC